MALARYFSQKWPLIAAVIICGFILLLAQVDILSRQQALQSLQQKTQADMNRYALNLQQKLDRYKDLPRLLSTHSELINPLLYDWSNDARMRANLYLEQVNRVIGASDTYLMNAQGLTIAASNWSDDKPFVGREFSFRPYFQAAIEGKLGRYFALGTTSQKRGYFFSYPVELRGNIIGVIVVKIDLNEIENDWNEALTDLLVTDEDGVIFISTRPEWKFRTLTQLTESARGRIIDSRRYGDSLLGPLAMRESEVRPDGSRLITLSAEDQEPASRVREADFLLQSRPVPDAGFTVSILASTQPVQRQVFNALMMASFIYIAVVLLVMVVMARRRIVKERAAFKAREVKTLEENEARIRGIINSTQAGLITLDSQGRIESFNQTSERLFGYVESALQGQLFSLLLEERDQPACWEYIKTATAEQALTLEATGKCQDGRSFPLEITLGDLPSRHGRHFVVTIHDITEQKASERALQEAQAELESRVEARTRDLLLANEKLREEMTLHKDTQNELIQTAKLAVLGQMSAGINHELNQPLTAIRAYADNARQFLNMGRTETVETNLKEISQLTERMAKIIHPLKEFSRKTSGQAESVCLKAVRDGAMSIMYGRLDRAAVTVTWPADLDSCFVLGDIVRIEQVMVNLLGNAIQAMEQQADKRIDICLSYRAGMQILSVRDYGPGIPEQELERVFEPFYTTKKAGQGLGLGLSISHRIISSLGGELRVRNHPQGGAEFTLSLPADPKRDFHQQLTTI